MTDLSLDTPTLAPARRGHVAHTRPCIPLPDGSDELEPRRQWAERIGITDRTARKLNLRTTYIGGVAYVPRNASTQQLAENARRRNEPYLGRRPGRKPPTR